MSRRAKMHVKHARTAEVFTNTEIALPRWAGTTKKCARRRRRERQFWFFEHPQWNNAISKKYTFMQWISLVFESVKICNHFLNTPSEIHASDLPLAKFKVARHYAQCHFQQNKQYSIRGVEKTKIVNGNEGGNNKKMWTATRAGTTKLIFSTPPAREAHFRASTIVANEKKVALAWVAETLRCKIASARKVSKSYMVYHSNSKAHVRWVPNASRRWKTCVPATHSQQTCAKKTFSHERCCKNQKCEAQRRRQAKKKWTAPRAGTLFLCFATPPGREQQNIRKVSFCIRTERDKLHAFHQLKWRRPQRVG